MSHQMSPVAIKGEEQAAVLWCESLNTSEVTKALMELLKEQSTNLPDTPYPKTPQEWKNIKDTEEEKNLLHKLIDDVDAIADASGEKERMMITFCKNHLRNTVPLDQRHFKPVEACFMRPNGTNGSAFAIMKIVDLHPGPSDPLPA